MTENIHEQGATPKPPRKPRKPRTPRATGPTYTGAFAGGSVITYSDSKVITNYGHKRFRERFSVALAVLRGQLLTSVGSHTVIVKKGAVPTTMPISAVLGGAPDSAPDVRMILD